MAPIRGTLFLWSETGTEGGHWALQDERFVTQTGLAPPFDQSWDYRGLRPLNDGDRLTIFDKADPSKIVWQGIIKLKQHPLFTEQAGGRWIHTDQEGIARDAWAKFFLDGHRAELIPA